MRNPTTRWAALALCAVLLAGCDGGEKASPETPAPETPTTPSLPADPLLTVATFNALGAQHSEPGGHREELPSGVKRTDGMIALLDQYRPDIVGVQELQLAQRRRLAERGVGSTYATFGDLDNSVMWRRKAFRVLTRTTLTIPYFLGEPRPMPVVRLRLRGTRQVITVVNVHNPADSLGDAAGWRDEAVAIERAFVTREQALGRVVFLVGDLNAEEEAFCPLTRQGLLVSADGGSHVDGECVPPSGDLEIDWILGGGVRFSGYVSDHDTWDDKVSDHPFVVATVQRFARR